MDASHTASFFSSAEMEEVFRGVFNSLLVELDFAYVGKIRWARETGAGFKHLFYFYPFRPGADYFPFAALSFDYVPRIEAGKVRLRPDAKHSRVHLVVTKFGLDSPYRIERSRAQAKQKCINLAPLIVDDIDRALKPIRCPADALDLLRREKACNGGAFYHYPEAALSYAFALAKTGFKKEAEAELDTLLQRQPTYFPPETHAPLRAFLAATVV